MSYTVLILPAARRALAALPKAERARVDEHIVALATNPRPVGAIPLKGEGRGLWRIRVGDYRILYQIRHRELEVVVVDIGHRRNIYRGL